MAVRWTPKWPRTSSSHPAYASEASGGREGADSPGSPIMSTAWTRKCSAQAVTSPSHIAAFDPDPWSSTSGGASSGPHTSTNVSPSRVGTRTRSAGTGQLSSIFS